jgi:hypothetical protein
MEPLLEGGCRCYKRSGGVISDPLSGALTGRKHGPTLNRSQLMSES